jgi:aminocarboxymuconate-semialdehyde decarboxylase
MSAAAGVMLGGCAASQSNRGLRGYSVPAIDVHAHWAAPEYVELLAREGAANGAKIGKNARGDVTFDMPGLRQVFEPSRFDLEARLKAMDAAGVDMHALSLSNPMVYWAPPAFGARLCQAYNDALSAAHLRYPQRFLGLAALPMQAPELAVKEIERAAALPGIRGVYLATHINGKNLDDKSFWPVYAKAEALHLPLLLHPLAPLGGERVRNYYLINFLSNPYETGIAAASLVFGGVMDAFPELVVVLPHAGGPFPALIGRMDHGTTVRPETRHMKKAPSTYLRRFYYDTIAHSDEILTNLVRQVGADRVVLGSDHPADMGYERPVDVIERMGALTANERELIIGGNARRLLRL